MEESNNSEIYNILTKISNGEEIPSWEISRIEPLIYDLKFNPTSPGKSRVKLSFEDYENYWRLFDLTDGDIWFANAVYSHYDTFEFESSDWVDDDWSQGYVLQGINSSNIEKLKEILRIVGPRYSKLSTDDDYEKASDLLMTLFQRQSEEIKYSYTSHRNQCKERGAHEMIESETCNAFQNYGIYSLGRCFYRYITTVSILLSMYKMVGDTSLSISELLSQIGKDINIGGQWDDYAYEQDCVDFDDESYNRDVSWELDRIMTRLEENENIEGLKVFSEKLGKIIDKYEIGKWYKVPKDENLGFRIDDINSNENKIIVLVKNQDINRIRDYGLTEKRSYDIDDFNTFLYQPELFEQRKFGRSK
jgi:hypothetical protein